MPRQVGRVIDKIHFVKCIVSLVTERVLVTPDAASQALWASATEAILAVGEEGFIESVNPAAERLFGYGAVELVGRDLGVLLPEPDLGRYQRHVRPLWASADAPSIRARFIEIGNARGIDDVLEMAGRRKDGAPIPLAISLIKIQFGGRRLFNLVIRDNSQRQRERFAIRTSRDDMLAILDQMRVGSVLLDADERILFVNAACKEWMKVNPAAALGCPVADWFFFDATSRYALERALALPAAARATVPLTGRRPDGQSFWLYCDIQDQPDSPQHHILFLYDRSDTQRPRHRPGLTRYAAMVGASPVMRELSRLIEAVAAGDWTVLIEGETGVGKELVAVAIHAASPRRQGPFIPVNCASLAESLVPTQLFGHRRGAFTGAVGEHRGFFEAGRGGTLFLDEIGDASQSTQSALLRAIEQKEIVRLGDSVPLRVDVRLLAATHKDLSKEVAEGRLREDLFYRIGVARIAVPPLRERTSDIPLLAADFLTRGASAAQGPQSLSPAALDLLMAYPWPGNVRELKNAIEHVIIFCRHPIVQPEDLPERIRQSPDPVSTSLVATGNTLARANLVTALAQARGNRSLAAQILGISRATLYRHMAMLGLARSPL